MIAPPNFAHCIAKPERSAAQLLLLRAGAAGDEMLAADDALV